MKDRITKLFTRKLEPEEEAELAASQSTDLQAPADEISAAVATDYVFALEFESGDRRVFRRLPVAIGRNAQNDLVLEDVTVSGQHARLYFDARLQLVCIADLNSLNGVFVNGLPTSRNYLLDGARIRLGAVNLIYRQLENSPAQEN